MRSRIIILLCTLILPLFYSNINAQPANRTGWFKNSAMNILMDAYPSEFTGAAKPDYKDRIRELIRRTGAASIYFHACSQNGYTNYPSNAGIRHPKLEGIDIIRIWRDVTKEMGVRFFAYFSFAESRAELKAHPEFLQIDKDGMPKNYLCSNTKYMDTYVLPKMRELIEDYDVDGFWVDASTWSVGACYCPDCKQGFRKQYGQDPPGERDNPMWPAYAEFRRESFEKTSKRMGDLIHQLKPSCIYTPNYAFSLYQPVGARDYVDVLSGDVGHMRRTQMVSLKSRFFDTQGVPWDIVLGITNGANVKFLADGSFRVTDFWVKVGEVREIPASAPRSIEYLNQENAVVRSNGGMTTVFVHTWPDASLISRDSELIGQMADFTRERLDVFQDTEPLYDVGILHSASTFYSEGDGFNHWQPAGYRIEGAHTALIQNNYHVNILADHRLAEKLKEYRVVVLSQQSRLTPEAVFAIREYVRNGGAIVATGKTALDSGNDAGMKSMLEDVLGVRFLNEKRKESAYIPWKGFPVQVWCDWYPVQVLTAKKAHPMWKNWNEYNPEELPYPAMTVNRYGNGKVVYITGDIFTGYHYNQHPVIREIIEKAMTLADNDKIIETDAPVAVEFALRKKSGDIIVHMVNKLVDRDKREEGAIHVEHVPPAGPFTVKIKCALKPANVILKPSGRKLEWNWKNGFVWATIPRIHIHEALVIKGVLE